MTAKRSVGKPSSPAHGALFFGIGTLFGAIATFSCVAALAIVLIIAPWGRSAGPGAAGPMPDAHVELSLGDDGCHVVRSDVMGTTPVASLTWVMRDMDGHRVLERNAEGEYETKYFGGGRYRVYVKAWYSGRYHQISNEVVADCPPR